MSPYGIHLNHRDIPSRGVSDNDGILIFSSTRTKPAIHFKIVSKKFKQRHLQDRVPIGLANDVLPFIAAIAWQMSMTSLS